MSRLDHLGDLRTFACIVAAGSLSGAAREMNLSLAAISKGLLRLERALGARLVNRTTRQLSLTDEGRGFHARCLVVIEQLRLAEEAISERQDEPAGLLRVTASHAFCRRQIAPRLGEFLQRYPDIRFELIASDEQLDLIRAGIDVAIRQAVLPDSCLITRTIATDRRVPCAAPAYLRRHGVPLRPQDLQSHRCIVFGDPPITQWDFCRGSEFVTLKVDGQLLVTAGDGAHSAALGGAGVVLKSIWEVADDIAAGRLVELLPDWSSPVRPIHALCPSVRHQPSRVRCFIDFLAAALRHAEPRLPAQVAAVDCPPVVEGPSPALLFPA